MFSSSRRRAAALVAVVVLVGAGAAAVAYGLGAHRASTTSQAVATTVTSTPSATTTRTANTSGPQTIAQIAKDVSPGVVEVDVATSSSSGGTQTVPFGGGGSGGTAKAEGTGFVVDTAGHIVTNEHVVQGASSVTVTFDDQSTYKATVVGSDESTDIAVLKVNAPASVLHPLSFGDSTTVGVGDGVIAIGDPYQLDDTVTSGIVSAVGREITSPNNMPIENAIQTDAAINHGNSGGPLLNLDGKVIGITAQIQSQGGGNEGIGFAIPSNTVQSVSSQLISTGTAKHALLGITVQTIPASLAGTIGDAAGVAVRTVESGSGASSAGLKGSTGTVTIAGVPYPTGGDVVKSVDGTDVTTAQQLRAIIDTHQPGDVVKLVVVRDGQSRTVSATLGTRPANS